MTDKYADLRAALDAGPTPGPWKANTSNGIGPISKEDDQSFGMVLPVCFAEFENSEANRRYIAAANPGTIDALLADYDRMRDALEWYSSMSKKMCKAAIHQDSQAMLTLMKEIAVDYGKRARAAVEADRADHFRGVTKMVPSDEEIEACGSGGPMSLVVALDFADNPRPHGSLAAPADTDGELYKALRVLAAEYRALLSRYGSSRPAASAESECSCCGGTGEVDYPGSTCPACGGTGKEALVAQEPHGVIVCDKRIPNALETFITQRQFREIEWPDADYSKVAVYVAPVAAQAQHPDDVAVDQFAVAMKTKLAQKRAEGRGGWEDKTQCSQDRLSLMLRGHVAKGDPVDVANFCMMLHQRGERISGRDAASCSAQAREDAERWKWLKTEAKGHDFDNLSIRLPEQMDAYADAARAAKGADNG